MRCCIIVFCLGIYGVGFGQEFKDVLAAMQHQYKDIESMYVSMDIKAYEKAGAAKPFFEQHAVVKRQGTNYSYLYGDMEMLMNDRCLILIDHGSREITYRPRNEKSEKVAMSKFDFNLDSMLSFYEAPQYLGKKNETDRYRLVQKSGDVRQIDFEVLPLSSLIKQLSYTYREGQQVTIEFVRFDSHPAFAAAEFDETRILSRVKGKTVTTPAFLNYRIAMAESELNNH